MSLLFDTTNKIITIEAPTTEITVQEIYDKIRDWEDDPLNLCFDKIVDGSGKQDLGGGVKVGVTITLIDWKLKFEARGSPTICIISGGNIAYYNSQTKTYDFPLEYSDNVMADRDKASSATLRETIVYELKDIDEGAGAIKVYGVVKSNYDDTPQANIRVRALDTTTKLPLVENFSNADGEWYLYLDPGTYIFEFAGVVDSQDGFIQQEIEATVASTPSQQDFSIISIPQTVIDQGNGSKIVGWNGSSWTYGLEAITTFESPVEDVRVRAWLQGVALTEANLLAQHYTDSEGKYTLYLNPGDYILKFWKGGTRSTSTLVTVT